MKKLVITLLVYAVSSVCMAQNSSKEYYDLSQFFTDMSYSELENKVSKRDINKIQSLLGKDLVEKLSGGSYNSDYRVKEYSAVLSPSVLAKELRIGEGFSQYQNVTGMLLKKGENVIFVGDTYGKEVSLLLPDVMRKPGADAKSPTQDPLGWGLLRKEYSLHEGVNVIDIPYDGTVYVKYFDDKGVDAPEIKIHFLTGEVNGCFDIEQNFTNEHFNELLDNAKGETLDLIGKYVQIVLPVKWLKEYAYGKGVELVEAYDKMVYYEYEFMGLEKYGRLPSNKILVRVNHNYYMFRDGDGVAFMGDANTMRMVVSPESAVTEGAWGFCHEVGHVLQPRPLTWGGMTEVSNNILTNYATIKVGNQCSMTRLKYFDIARETIIDKGVSYFEADLFARLIPFWQLHLYFERNGYGDIYADVMEYYRKQPYRLEPEGDRSIDAQFKFIKVMCDVSKTDLTDFFEAYGFFKTGKMKIDDYAVYHYDITPEQVKRVKEYIASKGYAKPNMDITTIR